MKFKHYRAHYPNGRYKDALISEDYMADGEEIADYFEHGAAEIEHIQDVEFDGPRDHMLPDVMYSE